MTHEQRQRRSPLTVWLIAAALLSPFAYVLSTGPVIRAVKAGQLDHYAVAPFYWPLEWLANQLPPVAAFFDWYLGLWGLR